MRRAGLAVVAGLAGVAAGLAGAVPVMAGVGYRGGWPGAGSVVAAGRVPGGWPPRMPGFSEVLSVSCGSAGGCAAGGIYRVRLGVALGFVVSREHGVWGREVAVPGLAALNAGGFAEVQSVSCGSAGNCAAGGSYSDRSGGLQGFVVSEQRGVWGKAIEVPGLGALNADEEAQIVSVSCGSAGNCAAGGTYADRHDVGQGFVVSEQRGVWGKAIEVPGLGALDAGRYGFARVVSVSCAPAGNCAAGGTYRGRRGRDLGFVASEQRGVWGKATDVPGLDALDAGRHGYAGAEVVSVSCATAGYCAAGGFYLDRRGRYQGFVVSQRHGVWGKATEVPGLGPGGHAGIVSVSCASAGNCSAGGSHFDRRGRLQGFVVSQRHGVWGKATEVPGLDALNASRWADGDVVSVSCASAGNCSAGGTYSDRRDDSQAFVVSQEHGVWGKAIEVPGLRSSSGPVIGTMSVSCWSAGNCAAGGVYHDRSFTWLGFVVSEKHGVWGKATQVPGPGA